MGGPTASLSDTEMAVRNKMGRTFEGQLKLPRRRARPWASKDLPNPTPPTKEFLKTGRSHFRVPIRGLPLFRNMLGAPDFLETPK